MSLEISPSVFEIRSSTDNTLILNQDAKLIPSVNSIASSAFDIQFPNISKGVSEIMRVGQRNTSSQSPDNRSWRSYAWGLQISPGTQSGFVNLATARAGTNPNFILGLIHCTRVIDPNETVFGPFTKSIPEAVWMPIRSGLRLEYNAWMRRIVWLEIVNNVLRLSWKQSSLAYNPTYLDGSVVFWPDNNNTLRRPPGYQLGKEYRQSGANTILPPPAYGGTPQSILDAANAINFSSTWRFYVNAEMCQL